MTTVPAWLDRRPPREETVEEVDDTLIAAMRRLTPLERLRQNDRMIQTIAALRAAFAQRAESGGRDGEAP